MKLDFDEFLTGPTAIAFSTDDVAAVKVLSDASKRNEALVLKAGYIENSICDKAKLSEFAKIPSREGLYTMLAGGMIGIVKDLSIALNLYSEQKDGTAEVKEEPKAEPKEATPEEQTEDVAADETAEEQPEEQAETSVEESVDEKEGE